MDYLDSISGDQVPVGFRLEIIPMHFISSPSYDENILKPQRLFG